ncbi:hypothetical protein [Mucilaginibacter sp. L3T2-6]|uniref:nSTAND1 domain-containing NTPase n=1 Tax=Mucilaginibacter sp. L3T2-6 TaxID=3062491 RepID=UPI002676F25E|nr:hypothetical protein [Mucilaginibacter sp. L3T2-6]MDO3643854.1 hypothetical protein [Mucilaginibacter sp. L3T2-6]MDV6216423.1 hypothetical protein [Mucilaginibacter sp. L3T2-6]
MKQITLSQIENAFLPSREITSADRFSGRKEHVLAAYLSLLADGANIAILGNRGIGKSSLARQILNISNGDNSLLDNLSIGYDSKMDFLSIYFACGNNIDSVSTLLTRLLTTQDCLYNWLYDIPSATKEVAKISGGLNLGIISGGGEGTTETTSNSSISQHTIETVFNNVLFELTKAALAKNGILIVIDEFDQIKDTNGFAALLKSLATNNPSIKFCIVGVAHDIQNLMKEHESSDRLFAGGVVSLPRMNEDELKDIIAKAESSIDRFITFDNGAIKKLLQLAQGHPYMIHLLGKYSLREAYQNGYHTITEEHVNQTVQSIAEKGTDPVLEGRYKKAVASSPQREAVLKSFATSIREDGEIPTSDAYKLTVDFDVENPSQYVGQLVTEDYGSELVKVRERYYRFRDSLFVAYINARPWIFPSANKFNNDGK